MIRVMSEMSHRERSAELTRTTIIDAFLALAHSSNAVTVSIPAVSKEAGVSVRTVYRYFPSKNDLQNAAAYRYTELALGSTDAINNVTVEGFEQTVATLWSSFSQQLPAVYAEHATPAGRALRVTRLADSRTLVADIAEGQLDAQLDDEAIDLIVAVTSSSMFLELVDRMGYPAEHAASMAHRLAWLIIKDEFPQAEGAMT